MTIFESIIMGLIQGLTEFLPVSSSGHLVLGNALLGLETGDITFEVALHFASLLAILVYFFRRIVKILTGPIYYVLQGSRSEENVSHSQYFLLIMAGTIPALLVGLLLKNYIEQAFDSVRIVGLMLLVTSLVLLLTRLTRPTRTKIGFGDALVIGIAQAVAIMPGISRSGSTISTAMYLGIDKKSAFDFSFLLSLPAVLGASLLKLKDALEISPQLGQFAAYWPGMLAAFISGYICLMVLSRIVISGKFAYFGIYTLIIGIIALIFRHG